MTEPLIELQSLTKTIESHLIFEGLDLDIKKGEILSLVGPSGCGKTTLLRCLAGLEAVTTGHIMLNGSDVTNLPARQRPIVLMFQQPLLFPHLTVLENVIYGLRNTVHRKRDRLKIGEDLLAHMQLGEYRDQYPYALSGGQKQRVALARALAVKPKLLLLDEPLSSLDPSLRRSIRTWVKEVLQQEGMTTLFVTHDQEEAMYMGDRLAVLEEGRLQQVGDPISVYEHPQNEVVAKVFSDGLVLDDQTFVSASRLSLERLIEREVTDDRITHSNLLRGYIRAKWMKHRQMFYEVVIDREQQRSVIIPGKSRYQTGEQVHIVTDA